MGLFSRLRNVSRRDSFRMVTDAGNGFYVWDGKLYQSDIVRACIRPKTKAVGKSVAKHIRETITDDGKKIEVNPMPYIRFLLEEPNEYMSGQMLQEKVANQLALNNNAFILIVRDAFGMPCSLFPIPAENVEAKYNENMELYLKFYFTNGKSSVFPYSEIIHIRDDYNRNDIFGEPPGEALSSLMNVAATTDQGIIKAIKNSAVIRWLLKYSASLRGEDLKKNAKDFSDNFLELSNNTSGVAAVDSKADAIQIKNNEFVPNAAQIDRTTQRIYAFFNTNQKIVTSSYNEDEWIAYYEAAVEPTLCQMANEYTRKLFTRQQRSFGNRVLFESSNLTFASMSTKLNLVQYVDRGIMSPNEVRYYLNLAPVDGGEKMVRRLDTREIKEGGGEDEKD